MIAERNPPFSGNEVYLLAVEAPSRCLKSNSLRDLGEKAQFRLVSEITKSTPVGWGFVIPECGATAMKLLCRACSGGSAPEPGSPRGQLSPPSHSYLVPCWAQPL